MSQLQRQAAAEAAPSSSRTSARTIPRAFTFNSTTGNSGGAGSRLPSVNSMGMGALARTIGQLASHGARPSTSWLQAYSDATRQRLHHLRPHQLSVVIRSIVALEAHPGEEWLQDFDRTCYSHPGPFDGRSAVEVLASMTALGDVNYSFPQNVYLKVLSQPDRFTTYQELACLLHCLGSHNIPAQLWDEDRFLDVVGSRMGQVLASVPDQDMERLVELARCKHSTMAAVLEVDGEGCEVNW